MKSLIVRLSLCTGEDWEKHFTDFKIETMETIIKNVIENASFCYPTFDYWCAEKVIPELSSGRRDILFVFDEDNPRQLLGLAIIKLDEHEKKICSFRIKPEYQRRGIGRQLMCECLQALGVDKPLLTVPRDMSLSKNDSSNCYTAFDNFIKKHFPNNFVLQQKVKDYYRTGFTEYVYNGLLPLPIDTIENTDN